MPFHSDSTLWIFDDILISYCGFQLTLLVLLSRIHQTDSSHKLHFPEIPSAPESFWLHECTCSPHQKTQTQHHQPAKLHRHTQPFTARPTCKAAHIQTHIYTHLTGTHLQTVTPYTPAHIHIQSLQNINTHIWSNPQPHITQQSARKPQM